MKNQLFYHRWLTYSSSNKSHLYLHRNYMNIGFIYISNTIEIFLSNVCEQLNEFIIIIYINIIL